MSETTCRPCEINYSRTAALAHRFRVTCIDHLWEDFAPTEAAALSLAREHEAEEHKP